MKKFTSKLLYGAAALLISTSFAHADFKLNIIHINDLHSRIEPINKYDSTCGAEDNAEGKCFGGYARVKTMIDQLRSELDGQNVIVMDAGDQYQGS